MILGFLQDLPDWIEAIILVVSSIGTTYVYLKNENQKKITQLEEKEKRRFSRIETAQDDIEKSQGKILDGFERIITQLNNLRDEDAIKISELESELAELTKSLVELQSKVKTQESVIQGIKLINKLIIEADEAPDVVKEWIKKSSLGKFLRGEKDLDDILFEQGKYDFAS